MLEQLFRHEAPDGTVRIFDVRGLFEHCFTNGFPIHPVDVMDSTADNLIASGAIDKDRLAKFSPQYLHIPLLVVSIEGNLVIVDGNHRYVYASKWAFPQVAAYLIESDVWEKYLVSESDFRAQT